MREFEAHICPTCRYSVGRGHTSELCDWNVQATQTNKAALKSLKDVKRAIERFDESLRKLQKSQSPKTRSPNHARRGQS